MKKKYVGASILAAVLALFVVIPVITHFTKPEARTFHWVRLAGTTYREVSFQNSEQDIRLGGMLFVPEGEGPFPAAGRRPRPCWTSPWPSPASWACGP